MRSHFIAEAVRQYLHDENIAASKRVGEPIVVVNIATEDEVSS